MRLMLTGMSAILVCGCLGRGSADLLHARIREQQSYIAETERQMAQSRTELHRIRREADNLRAELARVGNGTLPVEHSETLVRVAKLQIHSLLSGGVNKDERPGDDAFVAQLAPVDDDGEVVKLPGNIELTLIDPAMPEDEREIGQWSFTADECRGRWTRGFAGAGYQFTVPLSAPPEHDSLVLHAKLTTVDGRSFDASHILRVTPANALTTASGRAVLADSPLELDDINDPPPAPKTKSPVQIPEWAESNSDSNEQPPLRDSTNWTEESIPRLR